MTDRETYWQKRLERLGRVDYSGPVLVALAIEEASIRIAQAIEKAGANSGLASVEDDPSSQKGDADGG